MISFVLGLAVGLAVIILAVIIILDFYWWGGMGEKERFYKNETERYKDFDLKVGIVEYKK